MIQVISMIRKASYFIIPAVVITNYYLFYNNSIFMKSNGKNEALVDEFMDTPIFEELVLFDNGHQRYHSLSKPSTSSHNENITSPIKEHDIQIKSDNKNINERSCTSPEKTKWIFESCNTNSNNQDRRIISRSRASKNTCNLCQNTTEPFLNYLNKLKSKVEELKKSDCERLVLFSVAFGDEYTKSFRSMYGRLVEQYHRFHNQCFFTFVLGDSEEGDDEVHIYGSKDGLDERIVVPRNVLPYKNNRRNTKIFKMIGHLIFPWTKYLIWQDAKFRMRQKYPYYWPVNYFKYIAETMDKTKTCVVYLGLPVHESSMGTSKMKFREEAYRRHCDVLTESKRKQVSDSQKYIQRQCAYYEDYFNHSKLASSYMVDSALMVRDMRSEKCRNFNADLGCTWLDEIHCFSDRDQVSFPYAMASMDVVEYNNNLDPEHDHRVFVDKKTHSVPMALILKSDCHYYFQATVRKCYPVEDIKSSLPPLPQKSNKE